MERVEAIVDGFRQAAIGLAEWEEALDAFGQAIGAHVGQIGALDRNGALVLNVMANVADETRADYFRLGGADPVINIRNAAVIRARPLTCLIEEDFATLDTLAHARIYRDLFVPHDVPHACMVRLNDDPHEQVALALLRTKRRGAADRDARRLVEAVAPGLAGAISTARRIGRGTEAAILATAETLAGAAILLGRDLRIVSLSPAAEVILRGGAPLTMRGGRLTIRGDGGGFERAFAATLAADARTRCNVRLMLRGEGAGEPIQVELAPISPSGPMAEARVLMTIRTTGATRSSDLLQATFGLTEAETAVGRLLADGLDPAAIAHRRGSAISTVRNQLKALMAKTDSRRQAELVLKMRN